MSASFFWACGIFCGWETFDDSRSDGGSDISQKNIFTELASTFDDWSMRASSLISSEGSIMGSYVRRSTCHKQTLLKGDCYACQRSAFIFEKNGWGSWLWRARSQPSEGVGRMEWYHMARKWYTFYSYEPFLKSLPQMLLDSISQVRKAISKSVFLFSILFVCISV